jgi:hypothetical protein
VTADEIIATCSHPKIAEAALRSIGREFCYEVAKTARAANMPPDAYLAWIVRHYGAVASNAERTALSIAVKGHDTPVLEGLRQIFNDSHVSRLEGRPSALR